MRIEHLVEFIDLAETLAYSKTSERMLVSESALSRHIRGLEDELATELFERTSRRVRLTAGGEQLLPHALRIAEEWTDYLAELQTTTRREASSVIVATSYFIGDLIARFRIGHPTVSVRHASQHDSSEQLIQVLERGECRFAVLIDPPELPAHIDSRPLTEDTYVAALPLDHPLASSPAIDPRDLARDTFISFPVGTDSDERIRRICRSAGFEPEIAFTADVGSSIAQFVEQGLGVTFLQRRTIAKMRTHGVAFVDLQPAVRIRVTLCWDRRVALNEPARTFRDFVLAAAATD